MRRFQEWVLTLGLAAATPGVALAGPLDLLSGGGRDGVQSGVGVKVSNREVIHQIKSALQNANLGGQDIHVEYHQGTAVLKGVVYTPEQRDFAVAAARRVPNVARVQSELTIRSSRVPYRGGIQQVQYVQQMAQETDQSNQAMAERIRDALKGASFGGKGVQIKYQGGVATVVGDVTDPEMRALADQVVSQIPGVQSFDNQLTIGGQAAFYPAPQEISGPVAPPQDFGYPPAGPQNLQEVAFQGQETPVQQAPPPSVPQGAAPAQMMPYAAPVSGASHEVYDQPNLPNHSYPTYATYPNYAQVTYPQQYSASAWPYIGPFYPYPQVPLGWRKVQLEWDDGYWQLNFRPRTEKWWWFMNPGNW